MPYRKIIQTFPHKPVDLYSMIVDVESYPLFVPHCAGVIVHGKTDEEILATMCIEYITPIKCFKKSYISSIKLFPIELSINITNADSSVFKNLNSTWNFKPCIGGTSVTYEISFDMHNPILNVITSSLFMKYSENMVEVFARHARRTLSVI